MRHIPAALLAVVLLAGCAGGGAATRFFIIDPVPAQPLRDAPGAALVVEILDLQVPQYLERPRIASRTGDNELVFSQSNQWGDNLRKNLARTMALNLSQLLDTPDVSSPYARSSSRPDFRVLVHIDEFERAADGHARVSARWQVVDGRSGDTLVTERVRLASPGPVGRDHAAIVQALRVLYGDLGRLVAESILARAADS